MTIRKRRAAESILAAPDSDDEAHVADTSHDISQVDTVVNTDAQVDHTVMGIPLLHVDV